MAIYIKRTRRIEVKGLMPSRPVYTVEEVEVPGWCEVSFGLIIAKYQGNQALYSFVYPDLKHAQIGRMWKRALIRVQHENKGLTTWAGLARFMGCPKDVRRHPDGKRKRSYSNGAGEYLYQCVRNGRMPRKYPEACRKLKALGAIVEGVNNDGKET